MARFLITVWPVHGHYFPLVSIARALRERGHEVAFYSGSAARAVVEEEGCVYFPFNAVDDIYVNDMMYSRETYASWNRPFQFKAFLRQWLLGTVPGQVADLEGVMRAWKADVILCDASMWGPMLVLYERHHIPVAVFSTVTACLLPGPDAPPYGLGLPRPRSWSTRLLARLVEKTGRLFSGDFRRAANQLRQQYGLPSLSVSVTEFTGQLPLYLVPCIPELDYNRRDLPPSVHYIGPCLWNNPSHSSAPSWLDQVPLDQPWVHVTEGTIHTQAPVVLQAAARGLADLPIQVLMTTGEHRKPSELGLDVTAPNIWVAQWISHSDLLPRTDLVVTTGGAGTVMSALEAGVPLIVVPTEWDKPENAQRVVEAGLGLRLNPRQCRPHRLRAAVEQVLQEPSFRANTRQVAERLANYDGAGRAAVLLEGLADGSRCK